MDATNDWGTDLGSPLSHVYIGSVVGIIGFVLGLIVLLMVTGTSRRKRNRTR